MTTPDVSSPLSALPKLLWYIVTGLRRMVGDRGRDRALIPMVWLIDTRLGRLALRFETLVARVIAGEVFVPGRPRVRVASVAVRAEGALRVPTRRCWLVEWTQAAVGYRSFLEALLANPETATLLAAAPGAGRILRSMCWMLGVDGGPLVALPAGRKLAPRKSRAGQYRKRVVKPVVEEPRETRSAMAIIFAHFNPGVVIETDPEPQEYKPPWFSITR
jgi:hypothetical protein